MRRQSVARASHLTRGWRGGGHGAGYEMGGKVNVGSYGVQSKWVVGRYGDCMRQVMGCVGAKGGKYGDCWEKSGVRGMESCTRVKGKGEVRREESQTTNMEAKRWGVM